MKVITKRLVIEDEEFVLIKDNSNRGEYYGTIPYSELDRNGKLKRQLNGYDMAIVLLSDIDSTENPISRAIKERQRRIPLDRFVAEGHTQEEIIQFIITH